MLFSFKHESAVAMKTHNRTYERETERDGEQLDNKPGVMREQLIGAIRHRFLDSVDRLTSNQRYVKLNIGTSRTVVISVSSSIRLYFICNVLHDGTTTMSGFNMLTLWNRNPEFLSNHVQIRSHFQ